jgi:hypothetical protein
MHLISVQYFEPAGNFTFGSDFAIVPETGRRLILPLASFSVSIDACWTSINNSRMWRQAKNEERLAGQSARLRRNTLIEADIVFLQECR